MVTSRYLLALLLYVSGNVKVFATANTVFTNREPYQQIRQQQPSKIHGSLYQQHSTIPQSSLHSPPLLSPSSSQIAPSSTRLQPHNTITGQYERTLNRPGPSSTTNHNLIARQGNEDRAGFLSGLSSLAPQLQAFLNQGVDVIGAVLGALLGAGAAVAVARSGATLANIFPFMPQLNVGDYNTAKNGSSTEEVSSSHRRKRNVEFDTDLAELTVMVLSAVQSGECMQRSICLMGSRIGRSDKGKMGFLLANKLIPESVQESQYFVTMKKALRGGESYCDKFRCRFS